MRNYNNITATPSGHGHYTISMTYRGKYINCTTNNMSAVDDYNSEVGERDGRELRVKRGYNALRSELIRKNNN